MSLNGNDTYLILNYSPSSVSVSTRETSYLIPGGNMAAPAVFPLTLNEIRYINNVSKAFKYGLLFFEDDIAPEMYAELHIPDWENILRDDQIEAIIADPTVDGLERLLAIPDQLYFERVYGVYVGMKNAGIPVSSKVEALINTRRKELMRGKTTTDISVRQSKVVGASEEKIKALEEQIAKLTEMLSAQQKPVATPMPEPNDETIKAAHDPVVTSEKPATPKKQSSGRKSSTSKAKTTVKEQS